MPNLFQYAVLVADMYLFGKQQDVVPPQAGKDRTGAVEEQENRGIKGALLIELLDAIACRYRNCRPANQYSTERLDSEAAIEHPFNDDVTGDDVVNELNFHFWRLYEEDDISVTNAGLLSHCAEMVLERIKTKLSGTDFGG